MSLKDLMQEESKKHYWGLLLIYRDQLRKFLSNLFTRFKHIDILEIGCFKGFLVGWLLENFPRPEFSWSYWGVDIIEPSDRRRDYTHLVMNAEALEFPANRFHAVIMIETLEHIVDYVRALREVYRVLRHGGGVFIQSVMCTDKLATWDRSHYHVLHPVTLSRLMEFLGFRDIEWGGDGNFWLCAYK